MSPELIYRSVNLAHVSEDPYSGHDCSRDTTTSLGAITIAKRRLHKDEVRSINMSIPLSYIDIVSAICSAS